MFAEAADLRRSEIEEYRVFMFPAALAVPGHDPFFSIGDAPAWITSFGLQLYLLYDDSAITPLPWTAGNASPTQLTAYRCYILSDRYLDHPYFSLDTSETWIHPQPFEAYMSMMHGAFADYRGRRHWGSSPFSSRGPSRSVSSMAGSRASSRVSFLPSSRASSPASLAPSDVMSRPPSAMSIQSLADDPGLDFDSEFPDPDGLLAISRVDPRSATPAYIPDIVPHPVPVHNSMRKGKGAKTSTGKFSITRQQRVDEIIDSSTVEATWTVPRTSVAIRVDLSQSREKLTLPNGNILPLDAFIRAEDQDSWGGSSGHTAGDAHARGFFPDDFEKTVWCRRCQFPCNGVDACELLDPEIFAGCERFEPDKAGMQELWRHELDSNEREAESVVGILTRFYTRIMNSKCKKKGCSGVATLLKLSKPYSGKTAFVGCSKWSRTEKNNHIYWPIPDNVDEGDLRFVMENNGLLPPNRQTPDANETCVLTVHPRIALGNCRFSHVVGGRIIPARMTRRECPTEMIIFIPVDDAPATRNKAIVILRNAHNHPMHPKIKPSNEDRIKLGAAVQAVGLTGLTAMKLLNAPSTSTIYAGARVAEHSPAFASARKVRDFISGEKKNAIPQGMEWEGVLYRMSKHEIKLPKSEQYIHTAMSKGGFKLVVTMHPQIAIVRHRRCRPQFGCADG